MSSSAAPTVIDLCSESEDDASSSSSLDPPSSAAAAASSTMGASASSLPSSSSRSEVQVAGVFRARTSPSSSSAAVASVPWTPPRSRPVESDDSSSSSICPICSASVPQAQFVAHVHACLGDDVRALGSQPQPQLVPVATLVGVVNVPAGGDTRSAADGAPHVLTSRDSSLPPHSSASSASVSGSPTQSVARPSAIGCSFSPSLSAAAAATPYAFPLAPLLPNAHFPTVASSSSSSSACAAASSYCLPACSSSSASPSDPFDPVAMELSDEELVRRLAAEEEAAFELERQERAAQAEREFAEFLKREGTCAVCSQVPPAEQLVQICDEAARRPGAACCEHKVCTDCLRQSLRAILRRMSPSSPSPSSDSSKSPLALTEADLVCPAPGCSTPLAQWQLKRVLDPDEFETLLRHTLTTLMRSSSVSSSGGCGGGGSNSGSAPRFVTCPNASCDNSFEALEGSAQMAYSATELGLDGKPLSNAARQHRARFRFRCTECQTVFCGGCQTTPYHDGFDCAAYAAYRSARKCRFCQTSLTASNRARPEGNAARAPSIVGSVVGSIVGLFGAAASAAAHAAASASSSSASSSSAAATPAALSDVCNSSDCLARRAASCDRTLPCGHYCGGIRGEKACLPCLHEECPAHQGIDSNEDDYCSVCYTEGLGAAPAIQLACGHAFHLSCMQQRLSRGWPSPRITFGFLLCPLCKAEISHPALDSLLKPMQQLRADVTAKATQRLAFEGMERDEAFTSPSGKYYGQKEAYAMDRFAYYMCAKCRRPYFGGQRRCEEAAAAQNEQQYNAAELVCGSCTAGSDARTCAKHGKEYIEFKCKFCCQIATFFCWGTTHFCTDCHRRQESGDYVTRKPVADLPKCAGPGRCPLGVAHPPNGQEFILGCGICRPRDF